MVYRARGRLASPFEFDGEGALTDDDAVALADDEFAGKRERLPGKLRPDAGHQVAT